MGYSEDIKEFKRRPSKKKPGYIEHFAIFLHFLGLSIKTGLTVSRQYLWMFTNYFQALPMGPTCEAVMVIPYFKYAPNVIYVPVGTHAVKKDRLCDVGAIGMCKAELSILENAKAELKEELGLLLPKKYSYTYLRPFWDTTIRIHLFTFQMMTAQDLISLDGTYKEISWQTIRKVLVDQSEFGAVPKFLENNIVAVKQILRKTE